ncbi:MAG: tripartite tricarboxylate transporter TctB family protein [Pseudomonadota bacterium]|nr:tripartite tricarboxylate transporter TctB family protein [Pseudomonadota bacterium]
MPNSSAVLRTEIATAACLAAVATLAAVWLVPVNTQPAASELDISPAFFPMLAATLVLVLSLALIAELVFLGAKATSSHSSKTIVSELVIWGAGSFFIWVCLPEIGFIAVSTIVIILGGIALGYRRWWALTILAIVFSLTVDFGAWKIFTVDLP